MKIVSSLSLLYIGLSHGASSLRKTAKSSNNSRRLKVSQSDETYTTFEAAELTVDAIVKRAFLKSGKNVTEDFIVNEVNEVGRFLKDPLDNSTNADMIQVGDFVGNLQVSPAGQLLYKADFHGLGIQVFNYTACTDSKPAPASDLLTVPNVCVTNTVMINVMEDPLLPDEPPDAQGGTWYVPDGGTLVVPSPGFMANDKGFGYNLKSSTQTLNGLLLFDGKIEGDLVTNSDGSFQYNAPSCWTGTENFSYQVCYDTFPSVCSRAVAIIEVRRNEDRPDPPNVTSDNYTVMEGVTLLEGTGSLLENDQPDKGLALYVSDWDWDKGFQGKLHVNWDGSFDYKGEPGELGTFQFKYEACYQDWDCVQCWGCVQCRWTSASITVEPNPDKPSTPPTPKDDFLQAVQFEEVTGNVLTNDEYNQTYNIYVEDGGGLHIHDDGYLHDDFDDTGNLTFVIKVCYQEWPDLCAKSNVTVTTKPPPPMYASDSTRRQGVASAYLVHWAGSEKRRKCHKSSEPSVTLSCQNDGEVSLIPTESKRSTHDYCTRPLDSQGLPNMNLLNCTTYKTGEVFVECRDKQANNNKRRGLVVHMHSEPVECDRLDSAFHSVWLNTWCNTTLNYTSSAWLSSEIDCSGTVTPDGNGETLCYEYALGMNPQPADVILRSANYESCLFIQNQTSSRRLSESASSRTSAFS